MGPSAGTIEFNFNMPPPQENDIPEWSHNSHMACNESPSQESVLRLAFSRTPMTTLLPIQKGILSLSLLRTYELMFDRDKSD